MISLICLVFIMCFSCNLLKSEGKIDDASKTGENFSNNQYLSQEFYEYDTVNTKEIISQAEIRLKQREKILVFVEIESDTGLIEITDFNKWPSDIVIIYNLVLDELNKPMFLKEIPQSESGDWHIEFGYFFNKHGRTIAIKTNKAFFNSMCSDNALKEEQIWYYDDKFNKVLTEFKLVDIEGTPVESLECVLNYNFAVNQYQDFKETPLGSNPKLR
jgi:hypothetical protein